MQARLAGIAAFLCCAYDVVTDWRHFDGSAISAFDGLLQEHSPQLKSIAIDLLIKDQQATLSYDGLERGVTSAHFITELIGSAPYFEKVGDLQRVAMALQVVDDVLDYEADMKSGDTNCLFSNRWREYLSLLQEALSDAEATRLFPYGTILRLVIRRAREKALRLATLHHQRFIDQPTTNRVYRNSGT